MTAADHPEIEPRPDRAAQPESAAEAEAEVRQPFGIRDCALIAQATGYKAQSLRELRDGLQWVDGSSIYHHFWGRLLQPQYDEPEYSNDFASWAYHGLHDKTLAERLSMVDPSEFDDIDHLRQELIDIVEIRLDESEIFLWSQADQRFHFTKAQVVVFHTGVEITEPVELARLMPGLGNGSVFYHFIDARRRTDTKSDDFSAWLIGFGHQYEDLTRQLLDVDPYFSSLKDIRHKISDILAAYFREVGFA